MKLEIERKFLMKAMPSIDPDEIVTIEQWYYKNRSGIWERARTWFSDKNGESWIHTIKKSVKGVPGVNIEDEKFLSLSEYNSFVNICTSPNIESRYITKKRYIYKHGDLKWEVDKFGNGYHLIIAEIEIPTKNHNLVIPNFIKENSLLEVTGIKQFNNRNLSLKYAPELLINSNI